MVSGGSFGCSVARNPRKGNSRSCPAALVFSMHLFDRMAAVQHSSCLAAEAARSPRHFRPKGPAAPLRRTSVLPGANPWRRANSLRPSISISHGIQKEGHDETSCPSFWSGQRGSNSLPPPWQGGALPDELCPRNKGYFSKEIPACQVSYSRFSAFSSAGGWPITNSMSPTCPDGG